MEEKYKGVYNEAVNKLYESIVWTHKIQRTYLETLESRRKVLAIFEIIFSSISGITTMLFAIFGNNIGTILSAIAILLSVLLSSILEKVETKHDINDFRKSSSSLWLLRCNIEKIALKIKGNLLTDEEISFSLDLLQHSFDSLVSTLPVIPNKFVEISGKKLKERNDEEVTMRIV